MDEISRVQAQQDQTILELEQKKHSLRKRLSSIEKLDLLVNVLTYKIFEAQHDFRKDMEDLQCQRANLLKRTDLTESQRALALAELDRKIADRKNVHESAVASLEGQRTELRRESALKLQHMDSTLETLRTQHDAMMANLEAQKEGATPAQVEEINRRMAELNRMLEKDVGDLKKLQGQGWKDLGAEEKLSALLESRGLRVTLSGNLLTASGRLLSRSEAECLGLLEGIDVTAWGDTLQTGTITTSETTSITEVSTDEISMQSRMSSEDVHYLKTVLGKPLTLALVEITATQPRDPIHYLGHWLFKYRYNQEVDMVKKREIQELVEERERLEREALHLMMQDEARVAVLDMVIKAEEEAIRRELERIAREAAALEDEDENEDEHLDATAAAYGEPATVVK